jgi:hypothetical protein
LIEATIEKDSNDLRFEKFAADLFSYRDGIAYETTAPTGDQGIDARAQLTLREGVSIICATTQRKGFRAKAESDIDKNAGRPRRIARLHVCFSQDLSEETLQSIKSYAGNKLPHAEVEVHGRSGLTDLAFRYQRPFTDNYGRELDEYTLWLTEKSDDDDDANEVNLLRVAVTTVFHPEIVKQRELLTESLVITALGDGSEKQSEEITAAVASGLKLERAPQFSYLVSAIESLKGRGLVNRTRRGFKLTDAGHSFRDQLLAQGVSSSLDGRTAFRDLLGEFQSDVLSNHDFSRLWRAVQQRLSRLSLNNGLKVIAELQSISQQNDPSVSTAGATGILSATVHALLDEIDALRLNDRVAKRAAEVLREMLANHHCRAFRWLSELAVKYVVICSLGLDPEIERRIRDRVRTWVIIPDTHVVLSYLCGGDEGHESCNAVLTQLKKLEGSIWLIKAVLEETAHHAVIADESFRDWVERVRDIQKRFPDTNPSEVLYESDNAFVKGFAAVMGNSLVPSMWSDYICQFRGHHAKDVVALARTLEEELSAEYKEEQSQVVETGRAFAQVLLRPDYHEVGKFSTLRCEWDGRLLASVVLYRQTEPSGRKLIIVSDSDRLRGFLARHVNPDRKHGLKVTDPAAIACALAVVPGSSVNLDCVRHFLFNARISLPAYLYESNVLAQAFTSARVLRNAALRDRLDDALIDKRPRP